MTDTMIGRMYLGWQRELKIGEKDFRTRVFSAVELGSMAWGGGGGGGALQTASQLKHDYNQAHLPHVTRHGSPHVTQASHRHAGHATQHSSCPDNCVYAWGDAAAGLRAGGEEAGVAYFALQHLHSEPNHTADKRAN